MFRGRLVLQQQNSGGRAERIHGIVADILAKKGRPPVGSQDNLRDSGLSSLDLVTLMLAVEDAFDLTFPQEKMTPDNFRSIDAIEALVTDLA
jgi:acyl carrier protein